MDTIYVGTKVLRKANHGRKFVIGTVEAILPDGRVRVAWPIRALGRRTQLHSTVKAGSLVVATKERQIEYLYAVQMTIYRRSLEDWQVAPMYCEACHTIYRGPVDPTNGYPTRLCRCGRINYILRPYPVEPVRPTTAPSDGPVAARWG